MKTSEMQELPTKTHKYTENKENCEIRVREVECDVEASDIRSETIQ